MGKRNFESRWVEYAEGEPVEAVEILLKLGHSILNRRKRSKKSQSKDIHRMSIGVLNSEVPEHPKSVTITEADLLKGIDHSKCDSDCEYKSPELFERGADGEIKAPF